MAFAFAPTVTQITSDTRVGMFNLTITVFSKIQLVIYYQCCVLIGEATSRLFVIAHYSSESAGRICNVLAAKKD